MAGLGSCCRHAAALMRVELWVRHGKTELACTSRANKWLMTSRREVKEAKTRDICIKRPKWTDTGLQQPSTGPLRKKNVKGVSDNYIGKLKALNRMACVLISLDCSDTDSASACLDKSFHLRKSHEYYYQVQLHIFVSCLQYCDLFVWSQQDHTITRVARDEEMLCTVLPIAEPFFRQSRLPELLTHRMDPEHQAPTFCSHCGRPEFGKMTTCSKCNKPFHYACAKLKRKVKK